MEGQGSQSILTMFPALLLKALLDLRIALGFFVCFQPRWWPYFAYFYNVPLSRVGRWLWSLRQEKDLGGGQA